MSVRIICMSDTHGKHCEIDVPEGDILIIAGDLTTHGSRAEFRYFNEQKEWLGDEPKPRLASFAI